MLVIIGSVLLFVGAIFGLVILINAFKQSIGQGLLSMFVPFYMLYFAFAKYSSPRKGLVLGGWFGSFALGTALVVVGTIMAASDAVAQMNSELAQWEAAAPPAALPGQAAAPSGGRVMRCDLSQQAGNICNEYRIDDSYTLANATEHCDMVQIGSTDRVAVTEGACPSENALARCVPTWGNVSNVFYRSSDPYVDNDAAMRGAETLCIGTFTRL